jgi:outer membrane protein W
VNFFLGAKSLDSSDWNPNDNQAEFGAVMSFGAKDWPVQIAGDFLVSADQTTSGSTKTTGATFEFDPGIRWLILKKGKVFPYIGGGVGIIGAAVKVEDTFLSVDAADASLGFWTDAGVFFRLGSNFNVGLDLRYSTADVDLDFGAGVVAQDVSAGGFSFGFLMGFGW